jgi:hypothetical protein
MGDPGRPGPRRGAARGVRGGHGRGRVPVLGRHHRADRSRPARGLESTRERGPGERPRRCGGRKPAAAHRLRRRYLVVRAGGVEAVPEGPRLRRLHAHPRRADLPRSHQPGDRQRRPGECQLRSGADRLPLLPHAAPARRPPAHRGTARAAHQQGAAPGTVHADARGARLPRTRCEQGRGQARARRDQPAVADIPGRGADLRPGVRSRPTASQCQPLKSKLCDLSAPPRRTPR